jgi:hypothetical protein
MLPGRLFAHCQAMLNPDLPEVDRNNRESRDEAEWWNHVARVAAVGWGTPARGDFAALLPRLVARLRG